MNTTGNPEGRDCSGDDELLVAYLDGELGPTARQRLERRLADDSELRTQLQELQRSWDLLDLLPRPTPDDQFTASTMTMTAQVVASDSVALRQLRRARRWRFSAWGIGVALSFLAGYLLLAIPGRLRERRELTDLPMILDFDLYRYADSIEFLRALKQRDLLPSNPLPEVTLPASTALAGTARHLVEFRDARDLEEIKRLAKELTPSEAETIRGARERFDALSHDTQNKIRSLHAEVNQAEDAKELRNSLARYGAFLTGLSPLQRADLLELPMDPRLDRIAMLRREPPRRSGIQPGGPLGMSFEDNKIVFDWVVRYLENHERELPDHRPTGRSPPRRSAGRDDEPPRKVWMVFRVATDVAKGEPLPEPTEDERARLLSALSDSGSAVVREHIKINAGALAPFLREWFIKFNDRSRGTRPGFERAVQRFLDSQSKEERERLRRLPREALYQEMRRSGVPRDPGAIEPPPPPEGPPPPDGQESPDRHRAPGGHERREDRGPNDGRPPHDGLGPPPGEDHPPGPPPPRRG